MVFRSFWVRNYHHGCKNIVWQSGVDFDMTRSVCCQALRLHLHHARVRSQSRAWIWSQASFLGDVDGEMMMTYLWWAEGWWTQRLWWRCCQWQCPCGSNRTWTRNWCFHRLKGLFPGHILKMDRLLHLRSGELTPYPAHRPGTAGPTMTALSDRRRWSRWTPSWTSGTGWPRTRLCPAGSGTEQESWTSLSLLH